MTSEELKKFGVKPGIPERKYPKTKMPHIRGEIFPLPITVLEMYKNVTLAGDIMFINGIRFINMISRHVNFMTAQYIANAEASTLK